MAATSTRSDALYPHGLVPLPQGVPMMTILKRLGGGTEPDPIDVSVRAPTEPSAFVKPKTVTYKMDGTSRRWDMVESHPSVAILLYHTQRRAFLLVRQFRPPVYANLLRHATGPVLPPLAAAFTFELCAGIVDKPGLSLLDIAREEVQEETGYHVPSSGMFKITSFLSAVGISGSRQTIFAADVDDSMLVRGDGSGGGLAEHGEAIEVVALPIDNVNAFLLDDSLGKSAGLMFALQWGRDRVLESDDRRLVHQKL